MPVSRTTSVSLMRTLSSHSSTGQGGGTTPWWSSPVPSPANALKGAVPPGSPMQGALKLALLMGRPAPPIGGLPAHAVEPYAPERHAFPIDLLDSPLGRTASGSSTEEVLGSHSLSLVPARIDEAMRPLQQEVSSSATSNEHRLSSGTEPGPTGEQQESQVNKRSVLLQDVDTSKARVEETGSKSKSTSPVRQRTYNVGARRIARPVQPGSQLLHVEPLEEAGTPLQQSTCIQKPPRSTIPMTLEPQVDSPVDSCATLQIMHEDFNHARSTSSVGEAATDDNAAYRKWFFLWWRVTFAPFVWKEESPNLVWDKRSLEADMCKRTKSTALMYDQMHTTRLRLGNQVPANEAILRLAQPKQNITELEPNYSMRVLLEDNVLIDEPNKHRSLDCWSKQPVMTVVDGWQKRASRTIHGPRRFSVKTRSKQDAGHEGKMSKLFELRASHNRKKIFKLLLQEHIFSADLQHTDVTLDPLRFTRSEDESRLQMDMERYMHTWRKVHAPVANGFPGMPNTSLSTSAAMSGAVVEDRGGGGHLDGETSGMVDRDKTVERQSDEKSENRSKLAKERRQMLKEHARLLKPREQRAKAASRRLKSSEDTLRSCWHAYLHTSNTLEARRKALQGIERALEGNQRLSEESQAATAEYEESRQASRRYERLRHKAAKVIVRFFKYFVLGDLLTPVRRTSLVGLGKTMNDDSEHEVSLMDRNVSIFDVITSSEVQEAVQEAKLVQAAQMERMGSFHVLLKEMSNADRSAVQTRWSQLSREYVKAVGMQIFIEISYQSVDKFVCESLNCWALGNLDEARRCLMAAQDINKRAVQHCSQLTSHQERTRLLQCEVDRRETLSNLESYLHASAVTIPASTPIPSSFVATDLGTERAEAFEKAIVVKTLTEQIEEQKKKHMGLLPEHLLAHAMEERLWEEHMWTFQQDLKFA